MELLALTLTALIAAGAVIFVAQPFLRLPQHDGALEPQGVSPRLARLERRDRALVALKELEFDHRTGKISDDDYRQLLGPLRQEAAEALRLLEGADARASRPKGAAGKPRRTQPPVLETKDRR